MLQRAIAAAVAAACLALALWAALNGTAHLGATVARDQLAAWEKTATLPGPDPWRQAYRRIQLSRWLDPLQADYPADLARLHMWQGLAFPVGSRESTAHRRYAAAYYREALGKRPTWALAWISFAENRVMLSGWDPTARYALVRANQAAPWEPGVQMRTIWLGLAMWDLLSEELRAETTAAVRRSIALDYEVTRIVRLAY